MNNKAEVSNGTLAVLVVAALVVSGAGTYMLLNKAPTPVGYFGGNTSSGYVNLTITQQLSFYLNDSIIEFGTGSLTSGTSGTCDSFNGSASANAVFTGPGCNGTGDHISLWNDGNVKETITVNSSHTDEEFFCNGATLATCNSTAVLQYKTVQTNCTTSSQTTYADLTHSQTAFCAGLFPGTNSDRVNLTAAVTIPSTAYTGTHTATLTFVATAD